MAVPAKCEEQGVQAWLTFQVSHGQRFLQIEAGAERRVQLPPELPPGLRCGPSSLLRDLGPLGNLDELGGLQTV